jgi:hypothetical protein
VLSLSNSIDTDLRQYSAGDALSGSITAATRSDTRRRIFLTT